MSEEKTIVFLFNPVKMKGWQNYEQFKYFINMRIVSSFCVGVGVLLNSLLIIGSFESLSKFEVYFASYLLAAYLALKFYFLVDKIFDRFGGKSIAYQHILSVLAKKPQEILLALKNYRGEDYKDEISAILNSGFLPNSPDFYLKVWKEELGYELKKRLLN